MIGKIVTGSDTRGLLRYLVSVDRASNKNVHTDPQIVAGSGTTVAGWRRVGGDYRWSGADLGALTGYLDHNLEMVLEVDRAAGRAGGVSKRDNDHGAHVLHIPLAVAVTDGQLGQRRWRQIAGDYVAKMGLEGCRWVAIHHGQSAAGNDHIHLVINRVRDDGSWVPTWNNYRTNQVVCRELEVEHRLGRVGDRRHHHGLPGYSQESARLGQEAGLGEPETQKLGRLVRAAAAASVTEAQFVGMLGTLGVNSRPYYSPGGQAVAGYSVALAGGSGRWYSPSKHLGKDLSLPQLRTANSWPAPDAATTAAWAGAPTQAPRAESAGAEGAGAEGAGVDGGEWSRRGGQALLAEQKRWREDFQNTRQNRRRAADLAGLVAAASTRLESTPGRLARAATQLARSAQTQTGDQPVSVGRKDNVAIAALNLLAASGPNRLAGWLAVLDQLSRMSRAVADAHTAAGERVAAQQVAREAAANIEAVKLELSGQQVALDPADRARAREVIERARLAPITGPIPPPQGSGTGQVQQPSRRDHHGRNQQRS